MVAILCCQLDSIWNELKSNNGGHTWEGFLLNLKLVALPLIPIFKWENTLLVCAMTSAGSLCKDMEVGSFCSLPACPYLAGKSIPSLATEPTLGFQYILKTSRDIQPHGLNNYWISGLPVHCWISWTEACKFFFFWEFTL